MTRPLAVISPTLDGVQTVRVLCPCGECVDSDAVECGSVPVTECPACGRRWTVTVCVDEAPR